MPDRRLKNHAASVVSDEAFAKRAERWPESTPDTKEAYFIRNIFDGMLSLSDQCANPT